MSIRGSGAPDALKKDLLAGVDSWLAAGPGAEPGPEPGGV
jgi:adenosine deaminase